MALVSSWVFALATLAFLLYAPLAFGLHRFLTDVMLAGLVGGLLLALPGAMRLLVPEQVMADAVARAAKATFVDQGVGLTTGRTGVLVFMAVAERRVHVVADAGWDSAGNARHAPPPPRPPLDDIADVAPDFSAVCSRTSSSGSTPPRGAPGTTTRRSPAFSPI